MVDCLYLESHKKQQNLIFQITLKSTVELNKLK